jgi:hypothetical protein
MTTIIVLFNLKAGVDAAAYEAFAKSTDLPIVNGLKSVDSFEVYKAEGLLSGAASPYQYIEIIHVNDMTEFGANVSTETMKKVAGEFRTMADNPIFIKTESLV